MANPITDLEDYRAERIARALETLPAPRFEPERLVPYWVGAMDGLVHIELNEPMTHFEFTPEQARKWADRLRMFADTAQEQEIK